MQSSNVDIHFLNVCLQFELRPYSVKYAVDVKNSETTGQ